LVNVKIVELKCSVFDTLVYMMRSGFVFPVLDFVREKASSMDQALLRYFITAVADVAEPPFSGEFRAGMRDLFAHQSMVRARQFQDADKRKKVDEFEKTIT